MNKTNAAESTLNNIRTLCAERDRKERERLRLNRLDMEKREEAEKERVQSTNSILNSYMDKVRARENQQSQERSQAIQNIHDANNQRKAERDLRTKEISNAINRGISIARENEKKDVMDDFMSRNKRLLDKGREAVERERNKTYFS